MEAGGRRSGLPFSNTHTSTAYSHQCAIMAWSMPRDPGLEELVRSALGDQARVTEKAMFGGLAFLLQGNLLCGVRRGRLMLRVGPENEGWAVNISGVAPVIMRGRRMPGYIYAGREAYADDGIRQRLLDAAVAFTGSLPRK